MYIVSFNDAGYDIGSSEDETTQDYYGPDIERLAAYVCKSDTKYPLTFERETGIACDAIGYFVSEDGDETAVMYEGRVDMPIFVE